MSVKVNLLPDIILQQRREARLKQLLGVIFIGWIIFLVLVAFLLFSYAEFTQSRLESFKKETEQLDSEVNSEENIAFRLRVQQIQLALDSIEDLLTSQNLPGQMLRTIAANTPSGVAVSTITLNEEGIVTIEGFATTREEVAVFIAGLERTVNNQSLNNDLGYFVGTSLGGTTLTDTGRHAFTLSTSYVPNTLSLFSIDELLESDQTEEQNIDAVLPEGEFNESN